MKKYVSIFLFTFIVLLSFLLHHKYINHEISGLHDWRQTQTGWNIRNFTRYDFNILNPRVATFNGGKDNIYRYEFPVYQWVIGGIQKIIGEDVSVIRYFTFLLGLCSLLGFYYLLKNLGFKSYVSLFGVWAFNFSPVFYYYTINPLPDNLALCAGIWFLSFFVKNLNRYSIKNTILGALFLSLSIASKLPFILFGGVLFFYLIIQTFYRKPSNYKQIAQQISIYIIILLPTFLWYLWVMPTWENGVTSGIFGNKITWKTALIILDYHLYIMFPKLLMNIACLPFLFFGLWNILKVETLKNIKFKALFFSFALVLLYFLFELNMIGIVHDYYMFPFLPFLFLLITFGFNELIKQNDSLISKIMIGLLLILMPGLTAYQNKNSWDPYSYKEIYERQNEFKNAVPSNEQCIIINDVSGYIFPYLIDKRGHIFKDDYLPKEWVKDIISRYKVKYIYSNSRKVEKEISEFIRDTVYSYGNINVFRLEVQPNQ